MPRRAARFGATTLACLSATVLLPAAALGSELIGRKRDVRLQVDANAHALSLVPLGGSGRLSVLELATGWSSAASTTSPAD